MSKIRIKRIKRTDGYEYNRLDTQFVNGIIHAFPEKGETMSVTFDKLGWGIWHTSPVKRVYNTKSGIIVKTKNSLYHIKEGWYDE